MKAVVLAMVVAVAVSGCSSSALMVEKPAVAYRASTATLEYLPATIGVEDNTQTYLQTRMADALVTGSKAVFSQGTDLRIRYQFVGHDEGSRVGRWLTAGLAGGSKTYILAEFVNPTGQVIGSVRAEGAVGIGIAGGSAKSGIDAAVKKIADYAQANFKR